MIRSILATVGVALLVSASGCASVDGDPSSAESGDALTATIEVKSYFTIGTGNAGFGENDINEPDGIVFDQSGNVVLTDAANKRIQVWDVKNKRRLGQFGSADIFHGDVVDLAFSPVNGQLIVTDESAHVAYAFNPPPKDATGDAAFTDYQFVGHDMFTENALRKVGGITFDSKGRIYLVDARKNLVTRYDADGNPDPTFQFAEKGSVKYLNGCEGVAVDEKRGNLYVSSEFQSTIRVFNLEDGSYKGHMIGRHGDAVDPGTPSGTSTFSAAIEGLWILDDYLLASDEGDGGEGHLQIYDLEDETTFDHDQNDYDQLKAAKKPSGYVGKFGHYLSPDSVAAWTDTDGESYVAIADQGHYKVEVYKWSDIKKAGKFGRKPAKGAVKDK